MCDFTEHMYFYSNACHVCRAYGKNVQPKRCSGCKMIAYCSREHQAKHWQLHKDLCKLLAGVVKQAGSAFGLKAKRESSMESWTRAKTNLMLLVQMKLGRKLLPYETEMFKFPRACVVCHETDSQRLVDCPDCPGTSFCSDHKTNNSHSAKCHSLRLCFEIETGEINFSKPIEKIVDNCHFRRGDIPKNMREVVDLCAACERDVTVATKVWDVCVSEYLTRPLTFLRAMEILNVEKLARVTVHVIGANAIETESLIYWETLLHCREVIEELTIVLVGPELRQRSYRINLCEHCAARNAKIYVQTVNSLYADYAVSKAFVRANYIIGFNLGIHEYEDHSSANDTWSTSIKELAKQDCPVVMTSYTLQESHEERKRLGVVLGGRVDFCYTGKNPFSSLRPYRDFESEDFFYQNNYMTVYKKIESRNAKIYTQTMDTLCVDYTVSKTFVDPNYIIRFNLEIHEYKDHSLANATGSTLFQELAKEDCLVFLTSYAL